MSQFERIACLAGGILLAIAATIMLRGAPGGRSRRQPPVDQLANQLKDAWAEHHTRA